MLGGGEGLVDEAVERVSAENGTLRAKVGLNADWGLLSRLMRRDLRFADVLSLGYVSLEAVSRSESCVRSRWADSRRQCVQARWKEGSWEGGKRRSRPSLKSGFVLIYMFLLFYEGEAVVLCK